MADTLKTDLMKRFARLFALIIKEFHSVWRDPKSRSLLFIPPIAQLFLFSHAATLDIENISLAVLCEDFTPVSREFLSRISGSKYFKKIVYVKNLEELKNMLDAEAVRGALYIKNDFTKKYLAAAFGTSRKRAEAELILDGRHTNGSQIIGTYLSQIVQEFDASEKQTHHGSMGTWGAKQINVVIRNRYNPNLYYHWFIISSLVGILSMSMVLLLSALSLAREKESGTFDELLVSPLKPYEILLGKLFAPLFFGVLDGGIILLAAKFIFHLPVSGSMPLYFFALFMFLISISGVGLFISSLAKTQQQAMLGVFVFMFPAMILSGYSAPIENIRPEWLQNLTLLNPLRFFLVISKGIILRNINFYLCILNLIPILLISVVTLSIANYSFKNRLE